MNDKIEVNCIEVIDKEVIELIALYDDLIPELIHNGKVITAIQTLDFLDHYIYEYYEDLTNIYSVLLNGFSLLKTFNSSVLTTLESKKIIGKFFSPGLHKTYGMYLNEGKDLPEDETLETMLDKSKNILGRNLAADELVSYSRLHEIIFHEIQYLVYILRDIVESGWPPIKEEADRGNDSPNRYISKEVKLSVWRRDQGKCCECGTKERIEFDHIVPVSKGGSNTERNIQLLCEQCNRKKSANII
ncbi:MAG: HNH endonuclease [Gammaproteobacteria bacterium]